MNRKANPSKITLFVSLFAVSIGLIAGIYVIGQVNQTSDSISQTDSECNESSQDKQRIIDKFNEPDNYVLPEDPAAAQGVISSTVDAQAISELVGECEVYALEKAYEHGARELRDLSDCGDRCLVTDDLRYYRITYKQVDGKIAEIEVG